MAGFIRCSCCDQPVWVTDEDVGLTVNCPRTGRMLSVRPADIQPESPAAAASGPVLATLPPPTDAALTTPPPAQLAEPVSAAAPAGTPPTAVPALTTPSPARPVEGARAAVPRVGAGPGVEWPSDGERSTGRYVLFGTLLAALGLAGLGVLLWQLRPQPRSPAVAATRAIPPGPMSPPETPEPSTAVPPVAQPSSEQPLPSPPTASQPSSPTTAPHPAPRPAPTTVDQPPEPSVAPAPRVASLPPPAVDLPPTPPPAEPPSPLAPPAPPPPPPTPVVDRPADLVEPPPGPPKLDERGFAIHTLRKRIDGRAAAELEKALLTAREIALDTPAGPRVSQTLVAVAAQQKSSNQTYPGAMLAAAGRADLAGLPFRIGLDSVLVREKAQAMNVMSKQLRTAIQTCIPSPDDPRPSTDDLFATLISERKGNFRDRDKKQWARAEAVPCVVQMLQAENHEVRRMSCELLQALNVPEATEALVKWAVFDTNPGNRAAAVAALRQRDRAQVVAGLSQYLQYPWPRAVEHACEALVALNAQDALPQLARAYTQPDPDAPFRVNLPNKAGGMFQRELVRVNHPRNCILCHTPSFSDQDLVRGAVPDPNRPLAPPTTPAYYNSGGQFVAAEVTYLQQDFSLVQPVLNAGNWPVYQRFDYFVAMRRAPAATPATTAATAGPSPYRRATGFAIRELSGRDPETDAAWLAEQAKAAGPAAEPTGAVARFLVLELNPNALVALKAQEYVKPPLETPPNELARAVMTMQKVHGAKASRLALIAYVEPLTRTGDEASRVRASRILAVLLGPSSDAGLPKAMAAAEPDR